MLFFSFIPEVFLTSSIMLQLLSFASTINTLKNNFPILLKDACYQTIFILIFVCLLVFNSEVEICSFAYILFTNLASKYAKLLIVALGLVLSLIILPTLFLQKLNFYEFFSFFLLSLLSLLLLVSTQNLIFFYLTIELQTLCFYVLSIFNRKSAFSTEAGLKYFLLSSFMSALLLFGMVIFYSCLGTLSLPEIYNILAFGFFNYNLNLIINCGGIFIIVVLLFKIACAPFHFWAPDVYEGAPLSSTIVFSIVPKIGLIFFFSKWLFCLGAITSNFIEILLFLGVFSCFVGSIFSLYQKRLKGLIIFSSVAQIGFIVSGLSLNSVEGCSSVFIFLFVYLITSFLIWGHIALFYSYQNKIKTFYFAYSNSLYLTGLSGFFSKNPAWALSLLIIFFSIAGIPPFTGFWAKVVILIELVAQNKLMYSILLIIISSISVFYYIRILKTLFFEKKLQKKNKEEIFQIIFINKHYQKIYFVFILFLLILIFILFYPTNLYFLCQIIPLIN